MIAVYTTAYEIRQAELRVAMEEDARHRGEKTMVFIKTLASLID